MLAPRKKLWSTPADAALDAIEEKGWFSQLNDGDCICDIGCGDGRILLTWAERLTAKYSSSQKVLPQVSFLGIDIEADRIQQCETSLQELRENGKIHPSFSFQFVCANVLQRMELLESVTILFMYLIPRGLQALYEGLDRVRQQRRQQAQGEPFHILTYMAKLPKGEPVTDRALLTVPHQPGAEWPLYYYNWSPPDKYKP